ncbi:PIN domain-containing protein [Microbacterium sp.]|uniref:type II toxin-antitoxin system VapC family toxin n=1 Tax=Microbacterium sp. TaxID=51671 RepID=UPI0026269735|nr:PIN domain-containing protein [Microbacterium sp.]
MGMIYLDSCILIYALEDAGARGDRARVLLSGVNDTLVASPLVLHECLVKPIRDGDNEMRRRISGVYDRMEHVDLDASVFVEAAELRARFGLKAPDSLHLAAAQAAGCEQLWTNNKRLVAASRGLAVDVMNS